jgi:23S rRNA (adenine2503-C2)-methyltransferase
VQCRRHQEVDPPGEKQQFTSHFSPHAPPGDVETVFIPEDDRGTVCVSSQVGCSLSCKFCHTGTMPKANLRNLSPGEIVAQIFLAKRILGDFAPPSDGFGTRRRAVSHVVFMGMGEPLYNWRNVSKAIQVPPPPFPSHSPFAFVSKTPPPCVQIMTDPDGLALSKRRVTVSTSGVVPLIDAVGGVGVGLAVSLHAPTDALRSALMPINKTYPLLELMRACKNFPRMVLFIFLRLRIFLYINFK